MRASSSASTSDVAMAIVRRVPGDPATMRIIRRAVSGPDEEERSQYVGRKCYSRSGQKVGKITNVSICRLDGCGGTRLHVLWPDGQRTYPCVKGCRIYRGGYRIR